MSFALFLVLVSTTVISALQQNDVSRPDLSVFHPLNTTVKYGSSATFQCRVRSEVPPNIQWLKKIEEGDEVSHDVIKIQDERFRVLQSSKVLERSDGSFLNKLTIPEVYEADAGKYICLGANAMGYSFRSAYLTVLPRPRALPLGWNRSIAAHPSHPGSLLVAIPITLGILVGVLVAFVVVCHRQKSAAAALQRNGAASEVELEENGAVVTKLWGAASAYRNEV